MSTTYQVVRNGTAYVHEYPTRAEAETRANLENQGSDTSTFTVREKHGIDTKKLQPLDFGIFTGSPSDFREHVGPGHTLVLALGEKDELDIVCTCRNVVMVTQYVKHCEYCDIRYDELIDTIGHGRIQEHDLCEECIEHLNAQHEGY